MKLPVLFSLVGICVPLFLTAQATIPAVPNNAVSTYIHCTRFSISKPISEFPAYKRPSGERREAPDSIRRAFHLHTNNTPGNLQNDYTDPVKQTNIGSVAGSIAPIVNFEGMSDEFLDPPDPNGAVGPNHYVEIINSEYAVYDKKGNVVLAPKDLGPLWGGNNEDGDPVVLYDKFADRWLITEFQDTATPCKLYVALSKTSDPTGSYYVWEFNMGNTDPDYPKYSIWSDGYYVTFQGFNFNNNVPNVPQQVAVLERNRMIVGSPSAGMILANLPTPPDFQGGRNSLFTAPKTFDCDASAFPPFGMPNYLVFFENTACGGYSNSIVMYKLTTDTMLHTLLVTRADSFPVPTFNAYFSNGSENDISQPGVPNGVDALDGTFNFRVPYMRFTGYNSVVLSNTVNTGSKVAGIRWYELRQNTVTQIWSIYQEGTYAPNDGVSRWNGAICEDYEGNIAMEYCVASSSVYPGIRYTGRLVTDPLGQMTFSEQTAIAGTASLSNVKNRWGDYSQLDIDPSDGLTFWGTNEYAGTGDNITQLNRIFSFGIAPDLGIDEVQNKTMLKVYQDGSLLIISASSLPDNQQLVVDVFDMLGRQLTTQHVEPVAGMFETQINVGSLPKGIYFVRIGRENFQRVVKTSIN